MLERLTAEPAPTVEATLRALRAVFAGSGEGARAEARMIVGHVLGLDLGGLILGGDRVIESAALARIVELASRRLDGEPVQRLIGEADFYGLAFALTPETLVPRPDTETLVEAVLARLEGVSAPVLADLGVGSGAILVALLHVRSDARGVASDLFGEALATARGNAERHGVAARALFVRGSYASMLAPRAFDAIVSNPPYIETAAIAQLDEEVRLHDPLAALDGGADGLDAYRVIVEEARAALRPGGLLAVEIGHEQGRSVAALFSAAGFVAVETTADLAGRDRVVSARAPGSRASP
ncbi:peptide chain release factor N(5)-glutamine methyltransferase [Pinisolibacter sp. B13]|nr:peptide chain release factor N(5)-glutamine methyltransferase [Pinisolibacter aquiterrae]MBV5262887.1 peptide chain release factor N(5)-glutamine methyltransferase [Pinisolibacter aquiterrae]